MTEENLELERTEMAPKNIMARSFLDAALEKYDDDSDEVVQVGGFTVVTRPRAMQGVGGSFTLPRNTVVSGEGITHAGDPEALHDICGNIVELDLFKNSLKDWSEVFRITDHVPQLQQLNLGKNLLRYSDPPGVHPTRFSFLRNLILNSCNISWETIHQILLSSPSLNELHLCFNNFQQVVLPENFQHPMVTTLFFSGNPLLDPSEMLRLGHAFPCLTHLFLTESKLRRLSEEAELGAAFPHLTFLSLCMTKLEGWPQVDKLNGLPALTEVRLQGVPFLEMISQDFRRNLTIVHLPAITRLNSSSVDANSRSDAEWSYLRYHREDAEKPPLYEQLAAIHGEPSELAQVSLKPQVVFMVKLEVDGQEPVDLKLNILEIQTIWHLKKYLQTKGLVGWPANRMRLYYDKVIDLFGASEQKIPSRSLMSMHLNDGDRFLVSFKHQ